MGLGEISLGEMGLGEMGLGEMGQNRPIMPMSAVAEIADRTAYNALINDHLDNI